MIEINLFPEGLKARGTAVARKSGSVFEPKYLIYIVPVVIGLLGGLWLLRGASR